MFSCPRCRTEMKKGRNSIGLVWVCPECHGRAVTLEMLRPRVPVELVHQLWQRAQSNRYPRVRSCPSCHRKMVEVPIDNTEISEILDVCTGCHFIWFDDHEYQNIPRLTAPKSEYDISSEGKKALVLAQLEIQKEKIMIENAVESTPDHWSELLLGIFGMPVEYNAPALKTSPLVTWGLAGVIAIVSLLAMTDLKHVVWDWGFIPSKIGRYCGLTLITSFFLHGGLFHLIGNLYFLLVFGDNVEDVVGRKKYILMIALAALVGDIFHFLLNPYSNVPCIGASGGISGIIAYYALRFPRIEMGILLWFKWIRLPSLVMFLLWILMQLFGALLQMTNATDVSSVAHLGGASVGVVYWWLTKIPSRIK
jgi:membrane associated rhomboid family serine protease/Zn-finger nucleic acid-binding protein